MIKRKEKNDNDNLFIIIIWPTHSKYIPDS